MWLGVEWHAGELFPRDGFVVTHPRSSSKKVIRFYNRQGTAEQWVKEEKNAVKRTKMSCLRFVDNEAHLYRFALAYNLANSVRQLALPRSIHSWNPTTIREKLSKIGAKVDRRPWWAGRAGLGTSVEETSRMQWLQKPPEHGRELVRAGKALQAFLRGVK